MNFLLGFRYYAYVAAGAFLAGFAYGFWVESQRYAEYRGGVEAVGRAAEKARDERIGRELAAKKEAERVHAEEKARLAAERDAALDRLRRESGRRITPTAPTRTVEYVPAGAVCFDSDQLDAGIRASYDRLLTRLAALIQRGDDAIIEAREARGWAKAIGSCPPG